MADSEQGPSSASSSSNATPEPTPQVPSSETTVVPDRTELLQTARAFLNSPQVRHEDLAAKRNFLVQKGLNGSEVDQLLHEVPPQTPLIPPRTYPQPPPSNLPNLLAGVFKIATWITGGSIALLLMYFRFIYPRIAQTYQARLALRTHQTDLMRKLTTSIEATKAVQASTFPLLPQPDLYKEDAMYSQYKSLDDIVSSASDPKKVPDITLLRCAIQGLVSQKQTVTVNALFEHLEEKLPWARPEEDPAVEERLWKTLSSCPLFEQKDEEDTAVWTYNPPTPAAPPPVMSSLASLKEALPETPVRTGRFQHTLQTLSDFTGYIASQTYAIHPNYRISASGVPSSLSPDEEELRKEIRALKGLVLNRRSFMPPRPPLVPSLSSPAA